MRDGWEEVAGLWKKAKKECKVHKEQREAHKFVADSRVGYFAPTTSPFMVHCQRLKCCIANGGPGILSGNVPQDSGLRTSSNGSGWKKNGEL